MPHPFPNTAEYTRAPSLADEIAFEALPDDTRALVARLFGPQAQHATLDLLALAYERGARDAEDAAEVVFGPLTHKEAAEYVRDLLVTRGES